MYFQAIRLGWFFPGEFWEFGMGERIFNHKCWWWNRAKHLGYIKTFVHSGISTISTGDRRISSINRMDHMVWICLDLPPTHVYSHHARKTSCLVATPTFATGILVDVGVDPTYAEMNKARTEAYRFTLYIVYRVKQMYTQTIQLTSLFKSIFSWRRSSSWNTENKKANSYPKGPCMVSTYMYVSKKNKQMIRHCDVHGT